MLPSSPLVWTAVALTPVLFPLLLLLLRPATLDDVRTVLARVLLRSTFLAHDASTHLDAIGTTLVRLVVTRRRLLEWETAAASSVRGGTVHVAVGRGFPRAGGSNISAVHANLVLDLRSGGEVLADGEPFFRDGRFLVEADA